MFSERRPAFQSLLADLEFDSNATRRYDTLRGGFLWSDETPDRRSPDGIRAHLLLGDVIAYRASLTLGEPRDDLRADWDVLREVAPNWPGFRLERREGQVVQDLLEANEQVAKDFEDLERCLDRWDEGG